MGAILYYLMTFTEAALGTVGIRCLYEQPRYVVVQRLPGGAEVRDYSPRVAAETDDDGGGSIAFQRLFRYITGANASGAKIEMTAPVGQSGSLIAMTVPVQSTKTGGAMRFFLPADVVANGAPKPLDPNVRIVELPPKRVAALRFSGFAGKASVSAEESRLLGAVEKAGLRAKGTPFLLTYDAPFTIPFVRRNEVAVDLDGEPTTR